MRIDREEQRLLAGCVGASLLLHGAALAFAPLLAHAPALEPPRVLEVVFRQAPTPEPDARAPSEAAPPAPQRKPATRSPPRDIRRPAPEPEQVPDAPEAPGEPSSEPLVATSPPVQSRIATPAPTTAERLEVSSPPDFRAAYLRNPPPPYPLAARRRGEVGTVTLRVLVSAEGRPEQVELERSSGFDTLDLAAVQGVRQWRFAPARRGGEPHQAWVLVPIVFRLEPGG
jgi:protein TonB